MDYLVQQKDEILQQVNIVERLFDDGQFFDAVRVVRKLFFAINLLKPLWASENYAYKTQEILTRIENCLRANEPDGYAPRKAQEIEELKTCVDQLRGDSSNIQF